MLTRRGLFRNALGLGAGASMTGFSNSGALARHATLAKKYIDVGGTTHFPITGAHFLQPDPDNIVTQDISGPAYVSAFIGSAAIKGYVYLVTPNNDKVVPPGGGMSILLLAPQDFQDMGIVSPPAANPLFWASKEVILPQGPWQIAWHNTTTGDLSEPFSVAVVGQPQS
jgi:hypothetical protein